MGYPDLSSDVVRASTNNLQEEEEKTPLMEGLPATAKNIWNGGFWVNHHNVYQSRFSYFNYENDEVCKPVLEA